MSSFPAVFIIILNWNKLKETQACLDSVLKSDYPNFEIILVDNQSRDNSVQVIRERFPQAKVIENESNLGYTGGNNRAIEHAMARGADYLWLLNNDTVVEIETLGNLVKSAQEDEKIGLSTPLIHYFESPEAIEGCGRRIDWRKKRIIPLNCRKQFAKKENVKGPNIMVTGTALLIRRKVVETIGYLDDSFFAYYEDDDYSIRALKAGFFNQICGSSRIYHKTPPSHALRASYYYYYLTRNRYYFRSKHFNHHTSRLVAFLDHFIHSFLLSGICAPGKNYLAVSASLEGAWAGLQGITGPWEKRNTIPIWIKQISYPVIKTLSGLLIMRRILKNRLCRCG